jgi:CCR4-NOT transcription complex subunit 7/8
MDHISKLVDDYNYISMDTEYPGTVYVPTIVGAEFEYQMIKANCDNLKLIQVGIALSNEHGEFPRGKSLAWQFNL